MRFELREHRPTWLIIFAPALALLATFLIGAAAIAWEGVPPWAAYWHILVGAFGTKFALSETLTRATPLIFTGLAIAVAFRAKLWNIGGEGQLYAGALIVVALGTGAIDVPGFLLIPILLTGAAVGGAALLLGPTLLKTRFGVDEVVTTLLLNFIVFLFTSAMLDGPMRDEMAMGWPKSEPVLDQALLPSLVAGTRLHIGFLLGIFAAVVVWVLNTRTIWGFEMKVVGANPLASRFLGIPVNRAFVRVALISGALAGLAGAVEVLGVKGDLTLDFSPGYGYSGIIVGMLAALNPLGVVPAAIFVAGIFVGADAMSRVLGVSSYIADVLTAISLISMLVAAMVVRYRIRW
jgi:simple sugar transport system permease protein